METSAPLSKSPSKGNDSSSHGTFHFSNDSLGNPACFSFFDAKSLSSCQYSTPSFYPPKPSSALSPSIPTSLSDHLALPGNSPNNSLCNTPTLTAHFVSSPFAS